jgi:hypothetical protein
MMEGRDRRTGNLEADMTSSTRHAGAVVALTYKDARVFRSDRVGADETDISTVDILGYSLNMHHKANDLTGYYEEPPAEYWQQLADSLRDADEVLLVGHGTGKANATLQFRRYLERNAPDLATRVTGSLDVDVQNLTGPQVLALARDFYGEQAPRDYGDTRWDRDD